MGVKLVKLLNYLGLRFMVRKRKKDKIWLIVLPFVWF